MGTRSVAVSVFKATCLHLLDEVHQTGQPILITRRGRVIAQVLPPPPEVSAGGWLGAMRGRGRILGDVVQPAAEPDEWSALGP